MFVWDTSLCTSAQLALRALEAPGGCAATDKEVVPSHYRIKAGLPVAGREPRLEPAVLCGIQSTGAGAAAASFLSPTTSGCQRQLALLSEAFLLRQVQL